MRPASAHPEYSGPLDAASSGRACDPDCNPLGGAVTPQIRGLGRVIQIDPKRASANGRYAALKAPSDLSNATIG